MSSTGIEGPSPESHSSKQLSPPPHGHRDIPHQNPGASRNGRLSPMLSVLLVFAYHLTASARVSRGQHHVQLEQASLANRGESAAVGVEVLRSRDSDGEIDPCIREVCLN